MVKVASDRRMSAAPMQSDDALKEDIMLYNSGMESGLQFIPHSKVGADAQEQAIVDKSNVDKMHAAQYSRLVLPRNGRIHFAGAVVNNIITETAEKPVMTRYRGKENIGVNEDLKYHPLGYMSAKTNDKNIWAYRKEDIFYGIQPNAMLTSNIEYMPQSAQIQALNAAREGDGAAAALAKLYATSVDLAEFDDLRPPTDTALDSANAIPEPTEEGEYTDSLDIDEINRLVSETRRLNGTSSAYAPRIEEFFT